MEHQFWPEWAQNLQRSPWKGLIRTFLEGAGPIRLFTGQLMLAGSLFINPSATERWMAVAEMLEDDEQSQAFADLLKEEKLH